IVHLEHEVRRDQQCRYRRNLEPSRSVHDVERVLLESDLRESSAVRRSEGCLAELLRVAGILAQNVKSKREGLRNSRIEARHVQKLVRQMPLGASPNITRETRTAVPLIPEVQVRGDLASLK